MSVDELRFAAEFPQAGAEQWRAAVEKVLKGADFDKRMVTRTGDGIAIQPLYHPALQSAQASAPISLGHGVTQPRWRIEQLVDAADPDEANRIAMRELERGVEGLRLRVADPATGRGDDGILIANAADLDRVLEGVLTDIAPISLDAGARSVELATYLVSLWHRRGHAPDKAAGDLHQDPVASLASSGTLAKAEQEAFAAVATLVHHSAAWPRVRALGCDLRPYHNAGASPALELGAALAGLTCTLRGLEGHGVDPTTAMANLSLTVPVDDDVFTGIAKLRALRLLVARVLDACGLEAAAPQVTAETSKRMLTRRDPWVNLLRNTIAAFAGGVGGADAVTVLPFTAALGDANQLARRMARNTQLILADESQLGHVVDPAGGAWAVDALTEQLAHRAWERFQEIEAEGGIVESLRRGLLQARIAEQWQAQAQRLATRRDPITGVSSFPLLNEQQPELVVVDRTTLLERVTAAASEAVPVLPLAAAVAAADNGTAIRLPVGDTIADPLPRHRLAERFEALRDVADVAFKSCGVRHQVLILNLGTLAVFNARSTWAKNLLESGGFEAVLCDPLTGPDDIVTARQASGTPIAVLCSTDERYADLGTAMAEAAKAAGVTRLYVAGRPGDLAAAWSDAGVDGHLYEGMDVLAELTEAQAFLGLKG